MSLNLKDVIESLKSDKASHRQDGLKRLREYLDNDRIVNRVDDAGDGKAWLVIFQALFTTVKYERETCVKKGIRNASTPALKKLGFAAETLRWLTEKTFAMLNQRVIRPIIQHFLQMIVYQGSLLEPVAFPYLQVMRAILSFSPHRDHIESDTWIRLLSLSFAVLLGDPLGASITLDEDEEEEVEDLAFDTDMDADTTDVGDDSNHLPLSSGKRGRTPQQGPSRTAPPDSLFGRKLSREQIVAAQIISQLFQSPYAVFSHEDYSNLIQAILNKFGRFFETFPQPTSAHQDIVRAVILTLSQVELNAHKEVAIFGRKIWGSLINLWHKRDRAIKEGLAIIFVILFPFVTNRHILTKSIGHDEILKLRNVLKAELDMLGSDNLSLDCFNLRMNDLLELSEPFVYCSFRASANLTASQALTWVILELYSDCIATVSCPPSLPLHLPTAVLQSVTERPISSPSSRGSKRQRLEYPLTSLISSARSAVSPIHSRVANLQVLLFYIERHGSKIDAPMRSVLAADLIAVTTADHDLQTWSFMCLAALTYFMDAADETPRPDWETAWTLSLRRSTSPQACRVACHLANALLVRTNIKLSRNQVLTDIEPYLRDLNIQGPSFLCDSVCQFLCQCIRVTSRDVRLHRMRMEEKVLWWLDNKWNLSEDTSRGSSSSFIHPYAIQDIVNLLIATTTIVDCPSIFSLCTLPDCLVVMIMEERARMRVVREYMLSSIIPPYERRNPEDAGNRPNAFSEKQSAINSDAYNKERLALNSLQKLLDSTLESLKRADPSLSSTMASKVRKSVDVAVTAMLFDAILTMNGIQIQRHLLASACQLMDTFFPMMSSSRWSDLEKSVIMQGLFPLIALEPSSNAQRWVAMLDPTEGSGIKHRTLRQLISSKEEHRPNTPKDLLHTVWQSPEVISCFDRLSTCVKELLQGLAHPERSKTNPTQDNTEIFDPDDFDFVRTGDGEENKLLGLRPGNTGPDYTIASISTKLLATVGFLVSKSSTTPIDNGMLDIICSAPWPGFLSLAPCYFTEIQMGRLRLTTSQTEAIFQALQKHLRTYSSARSESLYLLVIQFLEVVLESWVRESPGVIGLHALDLFHWLTKLLHQNKLRSWLVRENLAKYICHYICLDPSLKQWTDYNSRNSEIEGSIQSPLHLLSSMSDDDDTRVRFCAATLCAHLFSISGNLGLDPMTLYDGIRKRLPTDLDALEHLLTRILLLGNIMVVKSAVRRGPFWHLLEMCLHITSLNQHVRAILEAVSCRLGLDSLKLLFRSYQYQIAFSIDKSDLDFLGLPPFLLGYDNEKDCASASLHTVLPILLLKNRDPLAKVEKKQRQVANICHLLQCTEADAVQACFPQLIASQIAFVIMGHTTDIPFDAAPKDVAKVTWKFIYPFAQKAGYSGSSEACLKPHLDGIIVSLLKMVQEIDDVTDSLICQALRDFSRGEEAVDTFQQLNKFRQPTDFVMHSPNVPAIPSVALLRSLDVLEVFVKAVYTPHTVYHVVHSLFAEIERTPLVNEQMRFLHAICIWVSINRGQFMSNHSLLQTLVRGAVVFLRQPDLVHRAQSVISWGLRIYIQSSDPEPYVKTIFRTVGKIAAEYRASEGDVVCIALSNELFDWAEKEAVLFTANQLFATDVRQVFCSWPRPLEASIELVDHQSRLKTILTVLEEKDSTVDKLPLIHQLHASAREDGFQELWENEAFWIMKDSIPSGNKLSFADAQAFAQTIQQTRGQVSQLALKQGPATTGVRHRESVNGNSSKKRASQSHSPKPYIIASLCDMLRRPAYDQVYLGYRTLRLLRSLRDDDYTINDLPLETRGELELLLGIPLQPISGSRHNIEDLLSLREHGITAKYFPRWVKAVTSILASSLSQHDPFFGQLLPTLNDDHSFSVELLPILVHQCLSTEYLNQNNARVVLSTFISRTLLDPDVPVPCVASIVELVQHLRHFSKQDGNSPLGYNKWLDLDFVLLSRGAISCGAFTTALLLIELSAEYGNVNSLLDDSEIASILYEIYSHIEEPDGFYAIKGPDVKAALIRRYQHEKEWERANQLLGAQFEIDSLQAQALNGVVKALHFRGFHKQASLTLNSVSPSGSNMANDTQTIDYSLGWRTEMWDLPDSSNAGTPDAQLYAAIRAIHCERDRESIVTICQGSLIAQVIHLSKVASEDLFQIRRCLQEIICLQEINTWMTETQRMLIEPRVEDLKRWEEFCISHKQLQFEAMEKVYSTKLSLLHSVSIREKRDSIGTIQTPFATALGAVELKCLVQLSEAARLSGDLQNSLNFVVRAQTLESKASFHVSEEFASVLWAQKEQRAAIEILKELRSLFSAEGHDTISSTQKSMLLARLGHWTSEARLENPTDIRDHYFDSAVALLLNNKDTEKIHETAKVFEQYAIFAHRQYQAIVSSPELNRLTVYMERKQREIRQLNESGKGVFSKQDLDRYVNRAKALLKDDSSQAEGYYGARDQFLKIAIEMYSHRLSTRGGNDTEFTIRLCSLWYSNFANPAYDSVVRDAIDRVPSHKFIFLTHQLTARLSQSSREETQSQKILRSLILRICDEHPFHILPQIYALRRNDDSEEAVTPVSRRKSSLGSVFSSKNTSQRAALDIYNTLRERETVRDVERLCYACLQWAKYPLKGKKEFTSKVSQKIPRGMAIKGISQLRVPIITADLPVDLSRRYDRVVYINRYSDTFITVGGLSLPKITDCIGSDGSKYKQLFKGELEDDLRQDAVMEQVFQLVNVLLARDHATSKRHLYIRPYKVVPLAPLAGVLEFVHHTIPLGTWLRNAHPRYRPSDMTAGDASELLVRIRKMHVKADRPFAEPLYNAFSEIRDQFQPVMRHFFTEKHKDAIAWFSMRLNYCRSVAVTSIVGHVLGLGDRHTGNILIDEASGEVVHIDFGIAFEQGKLLAVPETVPFRLTADMVDGFGISGTEGVFRRCAEQTLQVLRENAEIILTVLEVFKYDPLHSWTANPIKMLRAQQPSTNDNPPPTPSEVARVSAEPVLTVTTGGSNIDDESDPADEGADRALTSVSRKLDGKLSVEYTVNELIVAAMDPANLSLIFAGWAPHM